MKSKHEKRLVELTKQLRESNKRANTAFDAGIAAVAVSSSVKWVQRKRLDVAESRGSFVKVA